MWWLLDGHRLGNIAQQNNGSQRHAEHQPGDWWPPAERVTVTIQAADYGQASARVTETLPAGFAYVSSDLRAQRE